MRRIFVVSVLVLLSGSLARARQGDTLRRADPAVAAVPNAVPRECLAQIQVPFVENRGQWDGRVAFGAKAVFGMAFVTWDGRIVYSLPGEKASGWLVPDGDLPGGTSPSDRRRSGFRSCQLFPRKRRGAFEERTENFSRCIPRRSLAGHRAQVAGAGQAPGEALYGAARYGSVADSTEHRGRAFHADG